MPVRPKREVNEENALNWMSGRLAGSLANREGGWLEFGTEWRVWWWFEWMKSCK